MTNKPPIGIRPKWVHDLCRFCDLVKVIHNYSDSPFGANPKWISEAQEIYDAHKNVYMKEIPLVDRVAIDRAFVIL